MAKKKKEKVKEEALKLSSKEPSGGSKIKIIIPIIIAVIVIIAVVFIFILQDEDDGNGNGDGNQPPLAEFTYTPLVVYVNQTVNFDASNSTDPDGDELEYTWTFGDPNATTSNPNTDNGVTASHIYTGPGEYNVTLVVEDGNEGIDELSMIISVLPEETPTASLNFLKPNNSFTNIVWKLVVDLTDGTSEQLVFSNIRYNIYNGSDTNDVKMTGIVTVKPARVSYNDDDIYFDDTDANSVLSLGDFFSIAGDGGGPYPIEAGDNFQLIYEPNQGEMTNPEALP